MAASIALPALAAALVMTGPALSPPPLVTVEQGGARASFCDPKADEEQLIRVLEGMPPSWQPVADADDGPEAVWASRCASCHAMNGSARTYMGKLHRARDFSQPSWQACRTDGDIRAAIERGVAGSKMRAFKDHLTPEQLDGLVRLIRSFGMSMSMSMSTGRPVAFAR